MGNVLSAASQGLAAVALMALGFTYDEMTLCSHQLLLPPRTPSSSRNRQKAMLKALQKFGSSFTVRDETEAPSSATRTSEGECPLTTTTIRCDVPLDAVTRAWADERAAQKAEARAQHLLSGPLQFEDTLTLAAGSHSHSTPSLPLLAIQSLELRTDTERLCSGLWGEGIVWDSSQGW